MNEASRSPVSTAANRCRRPTSASPRIRFWTKNASRIVAPSWTNWAVTTSAMYGYENPLPAKIGFSGG